MGSCSSLMRNVLNRRVGVYQTQYGDQEKLDGLNKVEEDPIHQGSGTDQGETWTEPNLTGLGCRLPNSILHRANLKALNISNNKFVTEQLIVTIFKLEALEDLDMSNCSITLIPPEISMPKHLRKLNLSGNQLSVIPLELCSLGTLEELDLKNNNITTIRPEVKSLRTLTKIDISKNPLEEFPLTILKMEALEKLNLKSANITFIPPQLNQLTNLKEIDLSNNRLKECPLSLFELETLEILDLSNTIITTVPPQITHLKNLKNLNLSRNQLKTFPIAVCKLVTLETLDLSKTKMTTVPPQITHLKNLKELNLSQNKLEDFPMPLCEMLSLETIDLSKTKITTVPTRIIQLKHLKGLILSGNQLKTFPIPLCELATLETLDLSATKITKIPSQIKQLKHLKGLNLSRNKLKKFPMSVCEMLSLEIIDLSKTEITTVPNQITQLKNLKGLILSGNQLKTFPISLCELATLETLDLSATKITTVPYRITQLEKLMELKLSWNQLRTFPMSVCELVTLETLDLSATDINTVPPQITQLKNQKHLNLSYNQLNEFPLPVCELVTLENLDLSATRITSVPSQITKLKHLKGLILSGNQLKAFPLSVCELVTLETLDLSATKITTLPPRITQLKNLKELNLSQNKLWEFPTSVNELMTLETLDLSTTKITAVPSQITNLKNLKELNLSQNQFRELPMPVCKLVTLDTLDLSYNNITRVRTQMKQMENLRKLNLSWNGLQEFPMSVCDLVTLETLDLSGTSITTVPPQITRLKNLKGLKLSDNKLKEFPMSICELVTLETIDLCHNRISQVPSQIEQLQTLKSIRLDGNGLVRLPPEVRLLSNLMTFSLQENRIKQPPQEVVDRGLEAIKRYFDDLVKTEATSSFRLQVQVIGETGAGKTSLVKTLTSGRSSLTSKADRTHVMEQFTWSPKEEVFLNINDFGGHDVYKVAHNFFITKEALTLIVFNLQNVSLNYQEAVGSWIDNVYGRAPDSAMLLVGTHADCLSSEEVERSSSEVASSVSSHLSDMASDLRTRVEELEKRSKGKELGEFAYKEKMLRIKSLIQTPPRVGERVFVISSENGNGIDELKEELIRKAREKNYILPESWLQKVEHIETAKQNEQDPFLTLKSLENMTDLTPSQMQGGNDAQRIEDVLSFLHATGAVLWFRGKPLLKTFIFHRQDVFIDILKAVLRHDIDSILVYGSDPFNKKFTKEKFETAKRDVLRRGIISRAMLECLWRKFNLGKQGLDAMLELLAKFEVCYVADEDMYHFPWLLKEERPDVMSSRWFVVPSRDESQISSEIHFPVTCPTGLFEMAAVHLHGYLGQFKASRRDWKDGFFAQLDYQCRICLEREVIGEPPNGVIRLSIRGDDPIQVKEYSQSIFQDLLSLTEKECPGSPRDEFLVCPHCVHEESNPRTLFDTPVSLLSVPLEAPVPYHPCPEEEPMFMASADFYYPVTRGEMTRIHCISLERHAPLILKNIRRFDCLHKILSRLHRAGIFTKEEITAIQEPDQGNRLQSFLKGKSDFAFYQFCGALYDTGHAQTARLLRLPDLAMELPKDALREILQRLLDRSVITRKHMKDVRRETRKMLKVSTLLSKLREGKSDYEAERAFNEFRDAIYDERSKRK